ncbi:MAG TPA: VirB4 family type IV secretion/conjugal transfer ATPase [Novosphingobium sp.]|nr:VirB4 family type IV secretion/conjugal transfer ATPase [Novosphingobium sp.]
MASGGRAATPDFARETPAGARLPYARHIDDRTIALRDGALMQVIQLDGLPFETVDTQELNYRKELRDAMLRAIGSSRFALCHHVVRRQVAPAREAAFPDPFSARIDRMWNERLANRQLYANDLFLTLVRRPIGTRAGMAGWLTRGLERVTLAHRQAERAAMAARDLRDIEMATDQLTAALAHYNARVLGIYDTAQGPCSEPLEFLATLYNGALRPMRLPLGDLGHHLPWRRASFGQDTLELGPAGDVSPAFGAIVSIKDYPGQTMPGMLDELLRLPCEMTISQSFAFVDRGESVARMDLALRRMRAGDDAAHSLRDELALAKDEAAAGRAAFGEHHMSVGLRAPTQAMLDTQVAEAQAALADLGIVAVREDLGLEAAFWAQFPGNFSFIARRALIGSANFASLASGHNFATGRAQGNLWGDAVTLFETTAAGPYHFNFHQGDLGNFMVIGPSGSGKTVIVNFLLAQAQRFAPRIAFFDKDRGAELFIRAIGGRYSVLRPGENSGLNPLLLPDTAANRRFLCEWVACLAGGLRNAEEVQLVAGAVADNYAAPMALRRLSGFVQLLRGHQRPTPDDLYARLQTWWGNGVHAWLFDNAAPAGRLCDGVDLSQATVGFDMTCLLDDPVLRTPAMMYLFHRVDERLDGTPAIVVVDEGWKALDDEVFAARIRDWEKTIRKRGGLLGFVTQNAEDALASRVGSAIVEQSATQIFTPNPRARAEDYMAGFGLTAHELELIRTLPDTSRCFLVKQGRDSAVARLNLAGEEEILTILSGREKSVRLCDEIRARCGDDPALWLPELLKVA